MGSVPCHLLYQFFLWDFPSNHNRYLVNNYCITVYSYGLKKCWNTTSNRVGWLPSCGKKTAWKLHLLSLLFKAQVTENSSLPYMWNLCTGHGSSLSFCKCSLSLEFRNNLIIWKHGCGVLFLHVIYSLGIVTSY